MEMVTALEEVWSSLLDLLDGLEPDQWSRPTPCAEWNVKDVAAHLGHLEGAWHGFPQPEPPAGWSTEETGLHAATAYGVAARRPWPPRQVIDEVRRASDATLQRLRALAPDQWEEETAGVLGSTTVSGAVELRVGDAYVHLLDLRHALGVPLEPEREATALGLITARAVRLSGWAAVKRAGLAEGTRIRLDLSRPGAGRQDVVISGGRGLLVDPAGEPDGTVAGSGVGYVLAAGGRRALVDAVGGLRVDGEPAARLVESYRLFG